MSPQPLEPHDPRNLGGYRLIERLGEGGQGIVFLGEDPSGQQVAVKVLKVAASEEARAQLKKEMAAAQRVAQFCTAQVLGGSVDGPQPYVVSEYVEGLSLDERVRTRGPLPSPRLERLAVFTAAALTAIHAAEVVHRDLKPANVLLGPDGPQVVDFGIAVQEDVDTFTGRMIGTPAYMAPEQLEGGAASRASDVFSWAGTMVYAATGHLPFGPPGGRLHAISMAILRDEPSLAGVPDHLLPVLRVCLDKDPRRRPTARALLDRLLDPSLGLVQDEAVREVGAALKSYLLVQPPEKKIVDQPFSKDVDTGRQHWTPDVVPTVPPEPTRRRRLPVVLTLAVLAGAAAGGWFLLGGSGTSIPQADAGVWSGSVLQSNTVSLHAVLTLKAGSRTGRADFGTCAGDLTLKSVDGSTLTFGLTSPPGCPSGTATMYVTDSGGLSYELSAGDGKDQHGTLTKS